MSTTPPFPSLKAALAAREQAKADVRALDLLLGRSVAAQAGLATSQNLTRETWWENVLADKERVLAFMRETKAWIAAEQRRLNGTKPPAAARVSTDDVRALLDLVDAAMDACAVAPTEAQTDAVDRAVEAVGWVPPRSRDGQ